MRIWRALICPPSSEWRWRCGIWMVRNTTASRWFRGDHAYLRFASDLGAYDPATHDGSPETAVQAVMAWLCTRKDAMALTTPREVLATLTAFRIKKRDLTADWGG